MFSAMLPVMRTRSNGRLADRREVLMRRSSSEKGKNTAHFIELENTHGAHNYHPIPVVFTKAKGCHVWDPEGNQYFDFLSAYSAVNQGHCHPRIVETLISQAQKLTLSSRAFYNDQFPLFAKYITEYFGYDMVLPMNTGAEGVETAIKLARRWGYRKKKIPKNEALIVSACGCFHGRTSAVISFSCDPDCTNDFGPHEGGHLKADYNNIWLLENVLKDNASRICGLLLEPIQGEAGVVVPDPGYLKKCKELCEKYNILLIADEIQTGIARTGKMLACDHEEVRPDILILGKALSGGVYPVSAVLADKDVMLTIQPGEHGSTFGGNPLGSAVAMTALQVVKDENLCERSEVLGKRFREEMLRMKSPIIKVVRGRGLLNAIVIDDKFDKSAWDICLLLKHRGLLAKPTHGTIIRLTPPLIMTDQEMDQCLEIIKSTFQDVQKMKREEIPGVGARKIPPRQFCERCFREVY